MNLETKWRVRQFALRMLSLALTATMCTLFYLEIQFLKFLDFGAAMYPGVRVPRATASDVFHLFRDLTLEPTLLNWLPIALLVDLFIVLPIHRRLIK